jgi:choline dehydrogenase-like flavoprotein
MPIRSEHQWFKSSYSGGSGTECVEASFMHDGAAIRDSKVPFGPRLHFRSEAWTDFVLALQAARL